MSCLSFFHSRENASPNPYPNSYPNSTQTLNLNQPPFLRRHVAPISAVVSKYGSVTKQDLVEVLVAAAENAARERIDTQDQGSDPGDERDEGGDVGEKSAPKDSTNDDTKDEL